VEARVGRFTGEEIFSIVWWFSPHSGFEDLFFVVFLLLKCRGDYIGEEMRYYTLVLPSVTLLTSNTIKLPLTCRGDSQGSMFLLNSRSPLYETGILIC